MRQGDLRAVTALSAIARTGPDAAARAVALGALDSLPSQGAIDLFCSDLLLHEDPVLEKIAIARGYVPTEPGAQALFLYVTGQEDALCRHDPDPIHPLLARGYTAAPDWIKSRALRRSPVIPLCRILARALSGSDPEEAARRWSYGEWEVVTTSLASEGAWDLLWQLVPSAPPSHAVTALRSMKEAGWRPDGDDRQVFEELVRTVPDAWSYPAPEKPLISIKNQDAQCLKLVFSSDGTLLASGTSDGRVEVWQIPSGRLIASRTVHSGPIGFLAVAPGNTSLIAGSGNGMLSCLDIASGNTIWSYAEKDRHLCCATLSENGEDLLAGDEHGRLIRLACRTGKVLGDASGHPAPVTAIAPAPDGSSVAVGHADGTVCCRTGPGYGERWTAPGAGNGVKALAFSDRADRLLVVYERSLPAMRDGAEGTVIRACDGRFAGSVCHDISAEKGLVLVGGGDRVLRWWHGQERFPAAEIPLYNRLPACCTLSCDGTLAIVGCDEGTVYFFSIPGRKKVAEFRGYRQAVTACAISPDGSLLASAGGEGMVTLRSVPSGEISRTLRHPSGAVTALSFLPGPEGTGILAGTAGGMTRTFSCGDGSLVRPLDMYTPSVRALAISPDGSCLACAGSDATLRIWDLEKGGLAASCETPATTTKCLAFLPDSAGFVSGGWDGVARVWGISGGKPSAVLTGHSSTITCCCVDPKGRFFVTGSNDATLRIWPLPAGRAGPVLREAEREVSACATTPDGSLLAAAGTDPVIRLYHVPEGMSAGGIPQIPGKPSVLAFSNDGEILVAGYDHGLVAFYSVHGRSLIRTLSAHSGTVTGVAPVKGEDCIATSGTDGMIHTFRLPFMKPLWQTTLDDLALARELEQEAGTGAMAGQWRFLSSLLSLRFQNEIELCPLYRDAGMYDIQIVG